jgi:copper(I)-binding protein
VTHWTRRLLVGAVAVLVPALAGCEAGFNAPTLQYHPASNGVSVLNNGIAINNLFVLGPELNGTLPSGGQAGVFLSLEASGTDKLVSVSAPGTAASVNLAGGPVDLSPNTPVNLSGPQPAIVLTGLSKPLRGGQTIQLVLDFANAGSVSLQVPVEPRSYEYLTFSPPAASPTATTTPKTSGGPSPSPTASGAQAGTPSAPASASPTTSP